MEYLRNLPSKTNAFSSASYERVRGSTNVHDRLYFTTEDQTPKQVQPSSDENLILAAIRHKKEVAAIKTDQSNVQQVPDPSESESGRDSPQLPRLYKRPRIAISNAAASANATQSYPNFNVENKTNGQ